MDNSTPAEYDSPWKEALDLYFPEFMAFFLPEAYADIDWSRGYEFLDKELPKIVRDAELGNRLADKLVKVWRKDNSQSLVLIHIEIQSQYETDFQQRIFVYNYRIFDRYRLPVATLVILADERPAWRPQSYDYQIWGTQTSIQFPVVKLLDYEANWSTLEASSNPMAVMVMAHLKTQATSGNSQERLQWKIAVTKSLYQRGYSRQQILELFRLIAWMMTLPEELEKSFNIEITNYEEEAKMPYITPLERFAIEKGRQEGLEQGILAGRQEGMLKNRQEDVIEILETRFSPVPASLVETINLIGDAALLKTLHKRAITIGSIAEFEQLIQELTQE